MKFDLEAFKQGQKALTRDGRVADEDVEHFFGLDAPRQKYKTGRSWEVEV